MKHQATEVKKQIGSLNLLHVSNWESQFCIFKLSIDRLTCRLSVDEDFPALVVERLLIERTAEQDLTPPGELFSVRLRKTIFICMLGMPW